MWQGGTVKPRHISFNLQTQLATGLERLKSLTDDLMQTLGVPVSLSREDGQFRLHVSQPETPPVSLLDLMSLLTELPSVTAVLGLAEDGRPVLLDFSEQDMTHILVSGVLGAGKTVLLRSLIMSLAIMNRQSRIQFVILDGAGNSENEGATLQALNYLPHMLANVISGTDDIRETMAFLMNEVSYRLEYEVSAPTILVMIDEVVALLEMGEPLVRDAIRFLAQRGADVGVHLLMSTEKPQSAVLDNLLKANISVQIVGQTADSTQALAITGLQDSQAEYLLGQGDFLAIAGQYMTHFQAAYIGDYDLHMTLQELHRNRPPILLALNLDEAISTPDSENYDAGEDSLQHFAFNGNAISLHHEGIRDVSLAVEIEDMQADNGLEEPPFYVPQPVVHLFHDVGTVYEASVDNEDNDLEVVASAPHIETPKSALNFDKEKIYDVLGQTLPRLPYKFHKKPNVNKQALTRVQEVLEYESSLLEVSPSIESGENASSKVAKVKLVKPLLVERKTAVLLEDERDEHNSVEQDDIDLEDVNGDLGIISEVSDSEESDTEYEEFEDDWLPFDDD